MRKPDFLALKQIERRSQSIPRASLSKSSSIRMFRESLGMTLKNLAESTGVTVASIAQAERKEAEGKVNLETLRRAAEAMNCELTYSFVPKTDMKDFVEKRAYEKARRILERADLHMALEDQRVTSDIEERIRNLATKLIAQGKVW